MEAGGDPLLVVTLVSPSLATTMAADLEREYGPSGFEVVRAEGGAETIAVLERAASDGVRAAALIVDQELTPVRASEVIAKARERHPWIRVITLIEHHGMRAALAAMGEGGIDHFFIKPLAAHDEQLFPVLADQLDEWKRATRGTRNPVRVLGTRSQRTHPVCEFLSRNDITYRFVFLETDDEAETLLGGAPAEPERLPLVVLDDGRRLWAPNVIELAQAFGIQTAPDHDSYDVVVIGGGPAGLAATVYAASEGLRTVLLERDAPGGQAGQSAKIENYLGFPGGLRGRELAQRALLQAHKFEAEIVRPCQVTMLSCNPGTQAVELDDGTRISCASTLIACGVDYRRLQQPGLERLTNRGVYYGAGVTDAREHQGARVVIVGGANSAGQAALDFARHAERVTLIARCNSLRDRMSHYLVDRIEGNEAISVRTRATIAEAHGDSELEAITIENTATGDRDRFDADALFAFIGAEPRTGWLDGMIARDERGFVLTGRDLGPPGERPSGWAPARDPLPLETSRPGVFAAGDVRHGSIKRVAAAVGEGSMAVQLIHQHLAS